MRVAVYSSKPYDEEFLAAADAGQQHQLVFHPFRLTADTAPSAAGSEAVCAFVNDDLGSPVLESLADLGVRWVALRSAGCNNVDLRMAARLGLTVMRVPAYSPHAVAEHCVALVLSLNRSIHRAHNRVRDGNFALTGLLGYDLHGKTVGVVGTGRIGTCFARIMGGFGCRVLATDPFPNEQCRAMGVEYVPLETLLSHSDIVSLHCPLTPQTQHLITAERLRLVRPGMTLVNTGRGGLIDTTAVIEAVKDGRIGRLGLDVYENEAELFFEDRSDQVLQDDVFSRLLTLPNVLITGHQAFLTHEALTNIAETTLAGLTAGERGQDVPNRVTIDDVTA